MEEGWPELWFLDNRVENTSGNQSDGRFEQFLSIFPGIIEEVKPQTVWRKCRFVQ